MTDENSRVRTMVAESDIPVDPAAEELVGLLVGYARAHVDAVPEPGHELAALLGVGVPERIGTLGTRRRRALAAGVVALGAVVTTGLAAAANELPAPAQRWVSELGARYLHVDLPRPEDRAAEGEGPSRQPRRSTAEGSHRKDESAEDGGSADLLDGSEPAEPDRFPDPEQVRTQGDGARERHDAEAGDRSVEPAESWTEDGSVEGVEQPEGDTAGSGEDTQPTAAQEDPEGSDQHDEAEAEDEEALETEEGADD